MQLIFTSEHALMRSIKKMYPFANFSPENREGVWNAMFNDQKQYVGKDVEKVLEEKYQDYKKSNNI